MVNVFSHPGLELRQFRSGNSVGLGNDRDDIDLRGRQQNSQHTELRSHNATNLLVQLLHTDQVKTLYPAHTHTHNYKKPRSQEALMLTSGRWER